MDMDIYGHLWTFMDIYRHLWTFMDMSPPPVRQAAAEGGRLARRVSYVLKPTWLVVRWAFLGLG